MTSAAFGELRSLLHTARPDARAWDAVVVALNALDGEALAEALGYAADFMERPPWAEVSRYAPASWAQEAHPGLALASAFAALDPGALRVLLPRLHAPSLRGITLLGQVDVSGRYATARTAHTLDAPLLDALAALPALQTLTLWTLDLPDWTRLTKTPLHSLRRITFHSCKLYSAQLITLGQADWPHLEHLECRWMGLEAPMRPSMDELRAFAHHSTLRSLRTLALPAVYIYSDEEEDWTDWNGAVVGRGPRRAWADEARGALVGRWPDIQLIN